MELELHQIFVPQLQESLHDLRIELPSTLFDDFRHRFLNGPGFLIGPVVRQGIEYVRHGQ
jgi:hypothetical protein